MSSNGTNIKHYQKKDDNLTINRNTLKFFSPFLLCASLSDF